MTKDALFTARVLDGQGGAITLDPEKIANWTPGDGMLWLDMDYLNPQTQQWLRNDSNVPELIAEALLAEDTRPRTSVLEEGILLILRGVNLNPGAMPDDMVSIRLWMDQDRIISTRQRELQSLKDIILLLKKNKGPTNVVDFVVELIKRLVWRMTDTVDNLEDLVAEIEENVLSGESSKDGSDLGILRRQIIMLRRYLAPERDALTQLNTESAGWLSDNHRFEIDEIRDGLVRHLEDLNALRERSTVIQEEILGRISEQFNKRMYVLSIIAAIFLPLGFLTGLLGVNIAGIPGSDYPFAFYLFILFLIIIVLIQIWLFRFKKWF